MDVPRAASRLASKDVAALIGRQRVTELMTLWLGDLDVLIRNITITTGPPWLEQESRRGEVIDALTRGLAGQT